MRTLHAVFGIAWKDWQRFARQPFLIVVSLVMPLVFIFFYAIIVPSSATNPVAVALEHENADALALLEILRTVHSEEGPYYEIRTTDAATAREMFSKGDVMGMIVIPPSFEADVAARNATVVLQINNINSDYSKNLRLRLDRAVLQFNEAYLGQSIRVEERAWLTHDPRMQDYISTSLLLFAALYTGMVNSGLQVAVEWNERTVKTLLLAPVGRSVIVAGKVLAGLGQSAIGVLIVAAVLWMLFDFRPSGSLWAMSALVFAVMLLGAGLGVIAGVAMKTTLTVTSMMVAIAIAIFLISGNEDSLRGLAWQGPVVGLWRLAQILPTTYAFLAARSLFLTGKTAHLARDITVVISTTAGVLAVAAVLLRRAYTNLPGGQ